MSNLDLLEKIIASDDDYWVVAKRVTYNGKHREDDIVLIARPSSWPRNKSLDDMTLSEVKKLNDEYLIQNIFLSGDYSPFQYGQVMREFYRGFALKDVHPRKFLIGALKFESHDLWDYEKLAKALTGGTDAKSSTRDDDR